MILCIYSLLILYKCLFGVFFFFLLILQPPSLKSWVHPYHKLYVHYIVLDIVNPKPNRHKRTQKRTPTILWFGFWPMSKGKDKKIFHSKFGEYNMVERKTQKPKIPIHSKLFFHANTKFPVSKQSLELSKMFKTTPKMKRSFVGLISFEKDALSCTHRI